MLIFGGGSQLLCVMSRDLPVLIFGGGSRFLCVMSRDLPVLIASATLAAVEPLPHLLGSVGTGNCLSRWLLNDTCGRIMATYSRLSCVWMHTLLIFGGGSRLL